MKLSLNIYYTILNFIGWILLFVLTLGGPKIFLNPGMKLDNQLYFWTESVLCGALAYLLSYGVSFFIDYKIDLSNSIRKYFWKIVIVFVLIQVIYTLIIWPILDFTALSIRGKHTKVSFSGKIYNVFYFATLFAIWLFVFLTIKIYHQLKRVQLKQLQLESNLKESKLNTLKGQINPHFMFNSLNNIRGLMLEDVDKARNMLTHLSETLRYSLTKSEANSIAFEDELEMVDSYVAISKIQFDNRLQFEKIIDENSLTKEIPPMIVQMLIENAIKHGISKLKEGGTVGLTTQLDNNQLIIKVTNSGSLSEGENTTKLGLKNIRRRLELLYGAEAVFKLQEIANQVVATIKIPL